MARESHHSVRALDHQIGLWPRRPQPLANSRLGEAAMRGIPNQDTLETIFPPIADYAFLSDCENSCLIAPTGAVEWLCIPEPHDPSVFGDDPRSSGGIVSLRAGRQRGAGSPSVRTGDDGARHHVADPQRLVRRDTTSGRWHRGIETGERSNTTGALRETSTRNTSWCEPRRACTAASTFCSTVSPPSTTAATTPSGSTKAAPTTKWRPPTRSSLASR